MSSKMNWNENNLMLNSMFYHFDKIVDRITIIIVHIYQCNHKFQNHHETIIILDKRADSPKLDM